MNMLPDPSQNVDDAADHEETLRPSDLRPATSGAAASQERPLLTDEYVGSYRIIKQLGGGAFGLVYLAYQGFLDRQVAIKTLHAALGKNPNLERLFMHEARTIAKLRHPNIVTVYEFGATSFLDTSLTYMVMEYLPGETLRAKLKRERLPVEQVVEITRQIASALDYAHAHGVVHRDLKPGNIIFSEQQPVIVDFGLAQLVEMSASRETAQDVVSSGSLAGTPTYMAPEQTLGKAVGPASDQYALASIVYKMLTGRPAYVETSLSAMIKAKQEVDPPPLHTVAPHLPPAADAVLQRALQRDPGARYPSAMNFARALSEALLPDHLFRQVITMTDPVQAAQLRNAQQRILGFMWGAVVLALAVVFFSIASFCRDFANFKPAFMRDGLIVSSRSYDGFRDVTGLWPDSPAQKAGVQVGDRIKTDITYDRLQKAGDYTINGQPRAAYPTDWQPQAGDLIERTVTRNGQPVRVAYSIERSVYPLLVFVEQFPPAVLAFCCVIFLLKRWGGEPGIQLFATVLLAGAFALVASVTTNLLTNFDSLAFFLFLPLLIHLVLIFPEPLPWLEQHRLWIWLLYIPLPVSLVEYLFDIPASQFNMVIYAGYAVLLNVVILLKWIRRDLKRYRPLRLFISAFLIGLATILLLVVTTTFDDYATVKTVWNGNGLLARIVTYGTASIGAGLGVWLCTLGVHRVQLLLGPSIPTEFDSTGQRSQTWAN
jgi:tRNA A-37 threonylcarbamoyl transferase component Bud32